MRNTYSISIILVILISFFLSKCKTPIEEDEMYLKIIDTVEVYISDLNCENIHKIVDGENPIFIPNSNKILYRYYDQINTIDIGNLNSKFIATAPAIDIHVLYKMSVSSDGSYVAFTGKINGAMDLFIASIDDNTVLNITNTSNKWEDSPIFLPDGNSILFHEYVYENENSHNIIDYGLSKVDILGNRYNRIFNKTYYFTDFSSDGHYIIFRSYKSDEGTTIYIVHSNDYSIYKEILLVDEHIFNYPVISDDMYLYFSANENNLYRINLLTEERELLYSGYIGRDYTFSPNFEKVITANISIGIIDLLSGSRTNYFTDWNCDFSDVTFSPEGENFVFVKSVHKEIIY